MKNNSLTKKIIVTLSIFTFSIIAVIWLFQIVLLEPIYKQTKLNQVEAFSKTLVTKLNTYSTIDDLKTNANTIVNEQLKTIEDIDSNVTVIYYNSETFKYEKINLFERGFNPFDNENNLEELYNLAINQNSSHFTINYQEEFKPNGNPQVDNPQPLDQNPPIEAQNKESIRFLNGTFIKIGEVEALLAIEGNIRPLTSTTKTLNTQLLIISIVVLAASIILGFIFSKKIAKPINEIANKSKTLADLDNDEKIEVDDYSEVASLSESLNEAKLEIQKSAILQRDFLSNISHELRTPLTIINGYAELMKDIEEERTVENLNKILVKTQELNNLVNDIIDLSKLQSHVLKLNLEVINITKTIENIVANFNYLKQDIKYKIEFKYNEEVFINADTIRINQIMNNFLSNAVKYSKVDQENMIVIEQLIVDNQVTIKISDTGIGIKASDLTHIWDRYYKVYNEDRNSTISTGLGLAIVKELLIAHKFSYGVTSVYGKGTTFYFTSNVETQEDEENLN